MKKTYIIPTTNVVVIQHTHHLLIKSGELDPSQTINASEAASRSFSSDFDDDED